MDVSNIFFFTMKVCRVSLDLKLPETDRKRREIFLVANDKFNQFSNSEIYSVECMNIYWMGIETIF